MTLNKCTWLYWTCTCRPTSNLKSIILLTVWRSSIFMVMF